jgi:trans-AT polyketide synthase/acyltransferase/oxidoreductase domain-containing protein
MFSGQGAQKVGMGRDLFAQFPDLVDQADEILGYSVRELCLEDPDGLLGDTRYTQPAVFTVNAMAYRRWRESGGEPDLALGHSLGEYNALEAAGSIDFCTALRLLKARAQLTGGISGAMTAVLGMPEGEIRGTLTRCHRLDVEIVNFNSPTQLVLAGPEESVARAEEALCGAGAFDIRRLSVSGPFHSSYMAPAAERFAALIAGADISPPRFPVIANRTARPHEPGRIAGRLAEHIDHPVLWHASLLWILEQDPDARFVEVGESGILTRMLRRIRPDRSPLVS